MERVLAHRANPPFSYVAKGNGKVTNIDEDLGLMEITYSDGATEVISIGSNISSNSGGGFYLDQPMRSNSFNVGDTFSKGDVLAYNPQFFQPDPYSKQVDYKLGVTGTVVFIEQNQTLEDSTVISKASVRSCVQSYHAQGCGAQERYHSPSSSQGRRYSS